MRRREPSGPFLLPGKGPFPWGEQPLASVPARPPHQRAGRNRRAALGPSRRSGSGSSAACRRYGAGCAIPAPTITLPLPLLWHHLEDTGGACGHNIASSPRCLARSAWGGPRPGWPASLSRTAPLRPTGSGATSASTRPPALLMPQGQQHSDLPRLDRPPFRSPGGSSRARRDAGGRHSLCHASDAQVEDAGPPALMCLSPQLPRVRVQGNSGSPEPGLLFGGPAASFPAGTSTPVQGE